MSGRLRPKTAAPLPAPPPAAPAPPEPDDLAGIEAFAPHDEGSPEDPFVKAFAETRVPRHLRPGSEVRSKVPHAGLVAAVVVLVLGVLVAWADGGDGADVATAPSSSTTIHRTSSTLGRSTTTAIATALSAPTTIDPFDTTTSIGLTTATTAQTGVTIRPLTSPTFATSTTLAPDQALSVSFAVQPASPVVGQDVTVTITYRDPDAPPTSNCRTIDVDGARMFSDPCSQPSCSNTGAAAGGGVGGAAEVTFHTTFAAAGDHEVVTYGQSVQPYCHDRYGDEVTARHTITVVDSTSATTQPAPTTTTLIP